MSNTAVKQKKKWSTGKKVAVIVSAVIAVLLVLVIIAGVIALKWYCKVPEYQQVKTDKQVTLIAHRGYSSEAPENTVPAYEKAAEQGFWGAECDIYMTKDGVWVLSHDPVTYRMTGKIDNVEKLTLEELQAQPITNGSNIEDYPDLTTCTLGDYLQACKDGGMVPVIELKGKNNTEHYDKVVAEVEKYGVEAIYISFQYENLQKIRALTDAKVYYLAGEITDEVIEQAAALENCGIDFNANKEENFESGALDKCKEKGLDLAAWTVDDLELLDKLIDNGVTVITTNCITK